MKSHNILFWSQDCEIYKYHKKLYGAKAWVWFGSSIAMVKMKVPNVYRIWHAH